MHWLGLLRPALIIIPTTGVWKKGMAVFSASERLSRHIGTGPVRRNKAVPPFFIAPAGNIIKLRKLVNRHAGGVDEMWILY